MTVTWTLRGYDRRTEFVGSEHDIPSAMLAVVRDIVTPNEDDPDFVDPHEITSGQAARLAEALGLTIDSELYDYYVESEEDAYVVAAQVAALRAKA